MNGSEEKINPHFKPGLDLLSSVALLFGTDYQGQPVQEGGYEFTPPFTNAYVPTSQVFDPAAWELVNEPLWSYQADGNTFSMEYFELDVTTVANPVLGVAGGQSGRLKIMQTNNQQSNAAPLSPEILDEYDQNFDYIRDALLTASPRNNNKPGWDFFGSVFSPDSPEVAPSSSSRSVRSSVVEESEVADSSVAGPRESEIQLLSGGENVQLRLGSTPVHLQTIRSSEFASGGYNLTVEDAAFLRQQSLPFAQLPVSRRRILVTASTDDQGVSSALTETLTEEIDAFATAPAGSVNSMLHILVQRALREWEAHDLPGEAEGEQGDAANKQLAQLRAISAIEPLLISGALNPADLQAAIDRFHNDDGSEKPESELILGADQGSGLHLHLLPENDEGFTGQAVAEHRFVAVDLVLIPESPIELLADPPSSDGCEPELYIYELAFAEGAELDERFALDSSDLLGMLGGSSGELAQVFEASASLLDADLQGSFDLQLDVDGRVVFGYDARTTSADEFLYVDTIGLDRQRTDWPDGDPSSDHTLSFSVGDALDPTNAEITANLVLQLEELVLSAGVPGLTEIHSLQLADPQEVLRLNTASSLDLQRSMPMPTSCPIHWCCSTTPISPKLGLLLDLDLNSQPLLDLVTDLAGLIGDDLRAQVDELFGELDMPSAEELGCWRTLLPAIADLIAQVGGRLQAGEDLISRLPGWLPDQPASLLGGMGDGLVEISDSIQAFQDSYLEPEALVSRVNGLFRGANLPFELVHSLISDDIDDINTEHLWELRPTADLNITRQFSLDAAGFAQALAGNGSQVGDVLEGILGLTLGDLTANFVFDLAAAGSLAILESCEQGIRLLDTDAALESDIWPAFDQPHFVSFTLPGATTPSETDQELAIAAGLRLSELSFSSPLLVEADGTPRNYLLSQFGDGDPAQTFGLQLGMGLDLIDDELEAEPFELRQENRQ